MGLKQPKCNTGLQTPRDSTRTGTKVVRFDTNPPTVYPKETRYRFDDKPTAMNEGAVDDHSK